MAQTIRSRVLEYLTGRPHMHVTSARVARELGITNRQAITALHGLHRAGLGAALSRGPGSSWVYSPPPIGVATASTLVDVPVGWERTVRVVAKFGVDTYLLATIEGAGGGLTGGYLWARPMVGEIQWIIPEDGNLPPVPPFVSV